MRAGWVVVLGVVLAACRGPGWQAGPSVLALALRSAVDEVRDQGQEGWRVIAPGIPTHGAVVTARELP